ncbi:MAG: lactate utilization protein [Anaerolineales bacterium]|nr:lactate utilization protein [Anaerolineales bacterium]
MKKGEMENIAGSTPMTNSRDAILANIRQALAAARLPTPPAVSLPSAAGDLPFAVSLADRFAAELKHLSGTTLSTRPQDVPELLLELVTARNADTVLAWNEEHLAVPDALSSLRRAGIRIESGELPRDAGRTEALRANERIRVGITGVDAALAETGTLVVMAGPGKPRLAYMSVRTHIALIRMEQLHPSLAAWLAACPDLADGLRNRSALTFISGPSRTADIEMTLTVGVHGPAEVIAVMIRDDG